MTEITINIPNHDKNLLQKAKSPMIALINPQALKGRTDIKHGCNPCAVTHRAKTLLFLLLLAMTTAAQAQSIFGGSAGTNEDPYLIYNTDQLDQLAANVNSGMEYENVHFKLMSDLDYTGKTYTPIGISYLRSFRCGCPDRTALQPQNHASCFRFGL